jgi:hypothetical protein
MQYLAQWRMQVAANLLAQSGAKISLNSDAPLTCQFMLEDHAVRHSYHHLDRIRAALKPSQPALRAS